ncbi:HlyD family type I secretion periplasmic adaptor subunit [Actinobacillus pleuropneumoniae]|uniref:Membrane fusion protein (MFP) family protein n=3 Tax=Actinobacillus pleuropneumoniae TaxID=715 RepID=A0A0A0QW63_ACTPL|nr:HlyD family type I secretion periplasmic adaptor subunit [Actinobacillus pleuropneumoniae]ABY69900.1 RTX-III toxin determinant D [Actinobacillus pleuropneumoniae serovar 3 str. JL03]AIT40267.1 RTX-III toxin secretion component [Actinobacillus pleuropneumoniae]AIT40269.1 RTX-III toxin secretion component [Actinobacillus pleuropneumoniae]EFL78273.1 RTX-III toxin determinant D [Actinobacillus pleuropneumoniae serovar 2 str. 4226]EFL80735.1 RTX-III toxin determinant D [Actinobacillus pleuropneu
MKLWILGLGEFFQRYRNIWREIWKIRKQLDTPARQKDENEFLPAHLELIETPISKKPRLIAYLIMLFLFLAIVISIISKVEIVASATGKLVFSGHSKEIKPIENALVKDIFVKDGQFVEKGQLLLNLTALGADADKQKTKVSLGLERLDGYRYKSLLYSIEHNRLPLLDFNQADFDSVQEEDKTNARHLITEQFETWQKQKYQKELAYQRKQAEKQTVLANIRKYESASRIEKEKLSDLKKLYDVKSISKHELLAQENRYVEASNELSVYQSHLKEVESDLLKAQEDLKLVTQLFKSDILEKLQQNIQREKQLTLELEKNEQRQLASIIRAPVSGTVQQLKTHTKGGVVTTAETLMVIAPEDDVLEVSALIQNKDIGFVEIGQEAVIKVETFPYTRYGYLYGKVKTITLDAIEHPQLGLVFNSIIEINKKTLTDGDKEIQLGSGMSVIAEIKTGERSVISFLLSPLEESITESLRER